MRRLRRAIFIAFILSGIVFIGYNVYDRFTEDHTPPVISCDSDTISVSVEDEESALMKGVTATDNRDGDLTDSIRISSMTNFTEPGKRRVTYAVFDSSNLAATVTRTVEYTDYTPPQITLSAPLRFSIKDMEEVNLTENMKAQDCLDGDITAQIRATYNDSTYVQQAGDYALTVQVSNSAGDTCAVPVTVTVVDPSDEKESQKYYPLLSQYIVYTDIGKPVDLTSLIIGVERNGNDYLFDEEGESMSVSREDISASGNIDYTTEGTYNVDYQYTSEDGVTATTKLVVVVG